MRYVEIETKYNASDLNNYSVYSIAELLGVAPTSFIRSTSYNHYFTKDDRFVRYRDFGDECELTTKSQRSSNEERNEVNLTLPAGSYEDVERFLAILGFEHDFTTLKHSQQLVLDGCLISCDTVEVNDQVHYFLEIEALQGVEADVAWQRIEAIESKLSSLGVTPENRLQISVYQLFSTRK